MKGKQNGKNPLTKEQKAERIHFLFKWSGYILLYGAIIISIASLAIVIFPNSAELGPAWATIGFIIFVLWIIMAIFSILYGKYNWNVLLKIYTFLLPLINYLKLVSKKIKNKFNDILKKEETKK